MTRLLALVLLAVLLSSTAALEWPYSEVFANVSTSVESCAQASGFQFQNGTTPSARQLSKMCADPSCGSLVRYVMELEGNSSDTFDDPTKIDPARFTVTNDFSAPMLKFCWYDRLPTDPCPTEPFEQFAIDFAEPIATCKRESGLSAPFNITTAELEAFKKTNMTMPVGCYHLMMRVIYLIDSFPCVVVKEQIAALVEGTEFVYAFIEAIDPYKFTTPIYTYDEGWPVPVLSDLSANTTSSPLPTMAAVMPDAGDVGSPDGSTDESRPQSPVASLIKSALKSIKPTTTAPPPETSSAASSSSQASEAPATTRPTQAPSTTTPAPQWIKTARDPTATNSTDTPRNDDTMTQNVTMTTRSEGNTTLIAVPAAAAVLLLVLVVLVVRRRRRQDSKRNDLDDDDLRDDQYSVLTDRSDASTTTLCGRELHITKVVPVDALEDVRLIGTGGHAVVFLTVEKKSQRLLASKRLAKNHATDESIDVFLDEIELVSRLRHPCIVEFVGATWTNPLDIQALFEYMESGDLRMYLDTTGLAATTYDGDLGGLRGSEWTQEKTLLALDVAEALVYVHSLTPSPVVHRDLKSRNVLLTTRRPSVPGTNGDRDSSTRLRAKLSDFGVSR